MSLRRQGTTLFSAMLAFAGAAVVMQLWLLTVSMEALLSGAYKTLIPAAACSSVLLLINAGLLRYVFRLRPRCPRRVDDPSPPQKQSHHSERQMQMSHPPLQIISPKSETPLQIVQRTSTRELQL
jgi:Family of unknown function (DUF6755)